MRELVIRLTVPRTLSRRLAALIGVSIVCLGAIVFATVPNVFASGDPLSSSKMNQNFASLDSAVAMLNTQVGGMGTQLTNLGTRIAALEGPYVNPKTNKQYSRDAVYCGSTSAVTGAIGTYAIAKSLCESVTNCGVAAHMCTADEILRSTAMGVAIPAPASSPSGCGWYSTGASLGGGNKDCYGWMSASSSELGSILTLNGASGLVPGPGNSPCNVPYPILCCL